VLTYLELDGFIEATSPFYTTYQWRFHESAKDIVDSLDDEQQEFFQRLFRLSKVGRLWNSVVIADAVAALGCERDGVINALHYLEEKGGLEVKVGGVRQGYRMVQVPPDPDAVWDELCRRFAAREKNDIARVHTVVDLLRGESCLVRRLLAYFGEELGHDCGHCGQCDSEPPVSLERPLAELDLPDEELDSLRGDYPAALGTARQIARFLCGINSPALGKHGLTLHPRFGFAVKVPFAQIIEAVNQKPSTGQFQRLDGARRKPRHRQASYGDHAGYQPPR